MVKVRRCASYIFVLLSIFPCCWPLKVSLFSFLESFSSVTDSAPSDHEDFSITKTASRDRIQSTVDAVSSGTLVTDDQSRTSGTLGGVFFIDSPASATEQRIINEVISSTI